LLSQGHEVTLIASGDSAPMGRMLPICPDSIIAAMERGDAYEYWCYEAAAIVETLRRARDVDIVHSHLHAALLPFSHLVSVPVVHTLHSFITPDVVWLARRFPGNLVTVGHHQASVLEGVDGVRSIHNGIDIEAFPFCSQPDDYLLFLGRLIPSKGADIAIQTAKALCQPLIIAGPASNDHRAYFEEKILKAVRRAAPDRAKLLVIEAAIPDDPGPRWTKTLDIVMLALVGGIQRTYGGYEKLLARSGFRLDQSIDIGASYSIFEASGA
jgi:glycosyltransferase involved in cell wall biosynthesis